MVKLVKIVRILGDYSGKVFDDRRNLVLKLKSG
jgi:hypothetical protein